MLVTDACFHSCKTRRYKKRNGEYSKEWTLTQDYLEQIAQAQGGLCAISGQVLVFHPETRRNSRTASIDRLNNKKGYVPGNVRWVHTDINQMRRGLSDQKLFELCQMIVEHNK